MENKSLGITDDSPAFLPLLPGEILTRIMTFAMASDEPVFLWLFRNLTRIECFYPLQQQRGDAKQFYLDPTFPESQQKHLLDWVSVTGTCHRLGECGIPAFFRAKSFVVPPDMLQGLLDGKIRSPNFDLAMDSICKVVVPLRSLYSGSDFMILPKYHRFARLSAMTIRAPDTRENMLGKLKSVEALLQKETPKELHDLLRQLGLRLDITKLKLIVMGWKSLAVTEIIEGMEQAVYPVLRILIQRRAKPGVAPPTP